MRGKVSSVASAHVSYSLNSFKGGYKGEYIEYRGLGFRVEDLGFRL